MSWRIAKGLEQLRKQVNAKWPGRSKESDGSIGDETHATKSSDHNPWVKDGAEGVVTAVDITHDPADGFDSYAFADMLMRNRDPRIKYVISNRRIGSGDAGPQPWVWRKYTGASPHDHHVHISIKADKPHYDSVAEWKLDGMAPTVVPVGYTKPRPTVKEGSTGDDVKFLQGKLGVTADGVFGPQTKGAVVRIQNNRRIVADGIVGPATWAIINE